MRLTTVTMLVAVLSAGCGSSGDGDGSSAEGGGAYGSGSASSFQVNTITPADQALVNTFPSEIEVVFNGPPSAASITTASVSIILSGGDGDFSNGNETSVSWNSVVVSGSSASFDFSGTSLNDDDYRITLRGNGNDVITSSAGSILDGSANGTAGGDYISLFTVMAGAPSATTFSAIQNDIFNVSCALSGCHTGGSPTGGMNLSSGQAYLNIVGIASSEVPGLQRITPGNANDSYMVQKLEGTAAVGAQMPFGAAPLSNAKIQNLRDWIDAGAMDN